MSESYQDNLRAYTVTITTVMMGTDPLDALEGLTKIYDEYENKMIESAAGHGLVRAEVVENDGPRRLVIEMEG